MFSLDQICRSGNGIDFTQILFLRDFTEKLTNKMISEKYGIIFLNLYENLLKNSSHIEFDKIIVKFLLRP